MCLILNISATELPNFIRKYYLLQELLIFKYWRQNISVSNIALHILQSDTQASSPKSMWDSASVNSWNTGLHHSNSVATGQPTVLTLTQSTTRFRGSCRSVCTTARFVTSTSWSCAWSKSGNSSTRWSSTSSTRWTFWTQTLDVLKSCHSRTHTWQSITPVSIVDAYAFEWPYSTCCSCCKCWPILLIFAEIWWLVCNLISQCWYRIFR